MTFCYLMMSYRTTVRLTLAQVRCSKRVKLFSKVQIDTNAGQEDKHQKRTKHQTKKMSGTVRL